MSSRKTPQRKTIHVEGRTPGPRGKAAMVTLQDGSSAPPTYDGSHHEAAYLAAVLVLAQEMGQGTTGLKLTSPSDHLVEQMTGNWEVGEELRRLHDVVKLLAGGFPDGVVWEKAPRSDA